mmetsp:Transcript_55435/g.161890  ORF Transcript_55435/g.161890 Transcript_55435/m.161890 type:complete len:480 (-) Transcript_55435:83-1522(-)
MTRLALVYAVFLTAYADAARVHLKESTPSSSLLAHSIKLRSLPTQVSTVEASTASNDEGAVTVHLLDTQGEVSPSISASSVVRPLLKKTYLCQNKRPASCTECLGCFRLRRNADGSEYLYVAVSRSRPKYYRIRVVFRCPEGATFTISADVSLKGQWNRVGMWVDGEHVAAPLHWRTSNWRKRTMLLTKSWNSVKGRTVEVDLHFELRAGGWATVNDIVIQMSPKALACTDHLACLAVLAESDAGLQLRNDNSLQLQCLDGQLPDNEACIAWLSCLEISGATGRIRTLLLGAGVSSGESTAAVQLQAQEADASEEAVNTNDQVDEVEEIGAAKAVEHPPTSEELLTLDSCIDPRIEDPESWFCNCLDNLEETCLATNKAYPTQTWSMQTCLTALMCLDPYDQICGDWKNDMSCDGADYGELKMALTNYMAANPTPAPTESPTTTGAPVALVSRAQRALGAGESRVTLDGSVGGKATACE